MEDWAAWQKAPALTFLYNQIRQLLRRQGVEDGFVEVNGQSIHYYAAGPTDARRTVLLLHGLGVSSNDWWRAIPLLAWRGDRVIAIDFPGHGWTQPLEGQGYVSVQQNADTIRKLVAQMHHGEELAVVGHSLGGWVAARAHLDGLPVDKLVLVEAAGLEFEGMWESIELLRIEQTEDLDRYFRTICHKTPFGVNLIRKEVASLFKTPAVTNFLAADLRSDFIDDEELANIKAQVTLVWGENDGLIPPIMGHRWHTSIPGSKLIWIPKCGHAPQLERPILFQSILEEALGHPPLRQEIRTRLTARIPDTFRRRLSKA